MSGISVQINTGKDQASSSVSVSGFVQHIITDNEVMSFGLQEGNLKNAVGKYFGKNPNDAFLKSPTPWGDLYSTYHWPQTQTLLLPISARVVSVSSHPLVVATQKFTNHSSKTGTFNVSITESVQNTTTSNWSVTKTVDVTQTINYGISFLGAGGGGSTSFSYSQAWAQGGSQSQSITIGSTQAVTVQLDPGQSVIAELTASKATMKVEIVYQANLSGSTAVNYSDPFKGHHFWGLDLPSVMNSGGIQNSILFTETVSIDYFFNSDIQLIDSTGAQFSHLAARAADAPVLQPT